MLLLVHHVICNQILVLFSYLRQFSLSRRCKVVLSRLCHIHWLPELASIVLDVDDAFGDLRTALLNQLTVSGFGRDTVIEPGKSFLGR